MEASYGEGVGVAPPKCKCNRNRNRRSFDCAFDDEAVKCSLRVCDLIDFPKTSIDGKSWENRNGDRCGIRAGCGLSYLRSDEFWDRLVEIQKSHTLSG